MPHSITHTRIREVTDQLALARPLDADRLSCARNILLRGGWRQDRDGAVHFSDGAVVSDRCSCQEGRFIVCLHQLAADILAALANTQPSDTAAPAVPVPSGPHTPIGQIGGARFRRQRAITPTEAPALVAAT